MSVASTLILAFLATPIPRRSDQPKPRKRAGYHPAWIIGALLAIVAASRFLRVH